MAQVTAPIKPVNIHHRRRSPLVGPDVKDIVPKRRSRKTQQCWETYRPYITDLYERQGLELNALAFVMTRDHGFTASNSMYKKRFAKWELGKNRTTRIMGPAWAAIVKRREQGKESVIEIHGKEYSEQDVENFWTRKRVAPPDASADLPDIPELRIRTPDPNSRSDAMKRVRQHPLHKNKPSVTLSIKIISPSRPGSQGCSKPATTTTAPLSAPEILAHFAINEVPTRLVEYNWSRCEILLKSIQSYFTGFFCSPSWACWAHLQLSSVRRDAVNSLMAPTDGPYADFMEPGQMVGAFDIATSLFATEQNRSAWQLLGRTFDNMKALITEQHPQLLSAVLLLMRSLQQTDCPSLFEKTIAFMLELANAKYGNSSLLSNVLAALTGPAAQDLSEVALDQIAEFFAQNSSPDHPQALECRYIRACCLLRRGQLAEAEGGLVDLYKVYTAQGLDGDDVRIRQIMYTLTQVYIDSGRAADATEMLHSLLEVLAKASQFTTSSVTLRGICELRVECLRLLGCLLQEQNETAGCNFLQQAADFAGSAFLGPLPPVVLLVRRDLSANLGSVLRPSAG